MELKNISTRELVAELEKREGVEMTLVEPYQNKNVAVEGPAVVLIVTD